MSSNVLRLYPHNIEAYNKVVDAYERGEKVVGILHATGTGKTLIGLNLALDNKDKKILYVTRYKSILEHVEEVVDENEELNFEKDFGHVDFILYNTLANMSRKEIADLDIDILILDEFHHIGAPVWEEKLNLLIETHPNLKIFGMSAYSVRERGTANERDLAEEGGDELFSDKICSRYNLVDAMLEGVLPVPIYRTALLILNEFVDSVEKKVITKCKIGTPQYNKYMALLEAIKKKISLLVGMDELIKNNVKVGDKFIYFCPTNGQDGVNDIDTIMKQTWDKLVELGYNPEDIVFYKSTSEDVKMGEENRKSFYNDTDLSGRNVKGKLRIMFAINQYNEGVHPPNVNGVILGRGTKSDMVFFEQIGRALAVRGDTLEQINEYRKYSRSTLLEMCASRGILVNDGMTNDDLIEKIVAPVIIDLSGNFVFIRDLITSLHKEISINRDKCSHTMKKLMDITDNAFDVQICGEDIFEILEGINIQFAPRDFDEIIVLAINFYNNYNHLNIPRSFKTDDGINYNQFGYSLGDWVAEIRRRYREGKLSQEQIDKLNKIGMVWHVYKTFEDVYLLAKKYYEEHNNLKVPYNYVTEDGYGLGSWIVNQRRKKRLGLLSDKKIKMLNDIGMVWQVIHTFQNSYLLAKNYFIYYGDLNVPEGFKTLDGITENSEGFDLFKWISNQIKAHQKGTLSQEKVTLLESIGISWKENEEENDKEDTLSWDENYMLAKKYFEHYGNLKISRQFRTFDGLNYNDKGYRLGRWIARQIVYRRNNKLSEQQIKLLDSIGISWGNSSSYKTWDEAYKLAEAFYLKKGHLNIMTSFKTNDGVTEDENGYNLGSWIYIQRKKRNEDSLSEEQILKLDMIGMIWNINNNYKDIKELLKKAGLNPRKYSSSVKHLSFLEFESKMKYILDCGLPIVENGSLNQIFFMSDLDLQNMYGISRSYLIANYGTREKKV